MSHLTITEFEAGLPIIRQSPQNNGRLEMLVIRPTEDKRESIRSGTLDVQHGLVGDNWLARGSKYTETGAAHPDMQITLMNARTIRLLSSDETRWPLAGDQLFVDMDLSSENLPVGQQLQVGTAVLEITPMPHNGCKKFAARFGVDAVKFVNSPEGKRLHLRGIYAKVIQSGDIQVGDQLVKI
ncbi:MAG: hypothetical protein KDE48_05320 [Anaerolineales bacterium]|nr:hypothetical protein [Anaerolineales bacterium]